MKVTSGINNRIPPTPDQLYHTPISPSVFSLGPPSVPLVAYQSAGEAQAVLLPSSSLSKGSTKDEEEADHETELKITLLILE